MSVTAVSIVNSALAKIGGDPISSLTEETKAAKVANRIFTHMRDEVLRSHPWNFAIARATLSPDGTTPDSQYDFRYVIPSDCLRVLNTPEDDAQDLDWVVENGYILTDQDTELSVRYIYRNEDPSSWDSMFAETLAWRMAADLSYSITQSLNLFDYCMKQYGAMLSQARSIDGQEGRIQGFIADVWTNSRH